MWTKRSAGTLIVVLLALATAGTTAGHRRAHPQDGAHADLRITIEDEAVRFNIGVNLAFLDEAVPINRESLDTVAEAERPAVMEAFGQYIRQRVTCTIDGAAVSPIVETERLFADPDPGMIPLFPRTGPRGLIRFVAMLRYPAASPPEVVEITWPTFPRDELAAELEGIGSTGVAPRMVIEALLTAEGTQKPVQFSEPQPTLKWVRGGNAPGALFADVPRLPDSPVPFQISAITVVAGVFAVFSFLAAAVRSHRGRAHTLRAFFGGVAFSIIAVSAVNAYTVDVPGTASDAAPISESEAEAIFKALHGNLYRAFDYTSDDDIYDALGRSVSGDLHDTVYKQVKTALRQAENDDLRGVVTGIEPGEFDVIAVQAAKGDAEAFFEVRYAWTVDGTVYHWGHSHTRRNEYEAEYRVSGVPKAGWRLTDQRILQQRRLESPTDPVPQPTTVEQLLESLGGDDI